MTKNKLGQYFTKDKSLQKKVLEFILNNPKLILEPSIGRGDLVNYVIKKNKKIKFDMYEIDESIDVLERVKKDKVVYGDFLEKKIDKKYQTIIGNPPYIRTKTGNLYIDFVKKCFELLEENGELIFIVPSDFFKLTSSSKLLNEMMDSGTFTNIYHPHNEKLFENASIDVVIFRYCKNKNLEKKVMYNEELLYVVNNNGVISFSKEINNKLLLGDLFDVYVGLVSGKDEIYCNKKLGNIDVLVGDNLTKKFIFIKNYPSNNKKINEHLEKNKNVLIERKIKKFNDKNWFEWGAPRNINAMENDESNCIYIYNLTRKDKVAFIDKVQYFGGGLLMLKPKKKNIDLNKVIEFLNSNEFRNKFMFSKRFKIGHRQIINSNVIF